MSDNLYGEPLYDASSNPVNRQRMLVIEVWHHGATFPLLANWHGPLHQEWAARLIEEGVSDRLVLQAFQGPSREDVWQRITEVYDAYIKVPAK